MSGVQELVITAAPSFIRLFIDLYNPTKNKTRMELLADNCRIVAGLSGATAVILAAYGANAFSARAPTRDTEDLKKIFACGSIVHLIHSAALLAVPLTKNPLWVSALMAGGIIIFSGSCYYHALTANTKINKITPMVGAVLLGLSWFVMFI